MHGEPFGPRSGLHLWLLYASWPMTRMCLSFPLHTSPSSQQVFFEIYSNCSSHRRRGGEFHSCSALLSEISWAPDLPDQFGHPRCSHKVQESTRCTQCLPSQFHKRMLSCLCMQEKLLEPKFETVQVPETLDSFSSSDSQDLKLSI